MCAGAQTYTVEAAEELAAALLTVVTIVKERLTQDAARPKGGGS